MFNLHFNLIMFDWCGILVFDNENSQSKATKGRNTDQTNNTDLDSLHSRRLESCWPSFLFMCCQQKWGPANCNILVAAHCLIQGSYLQPVVGSFWPQCFDGEWTMFPGSSKPSTRKIIGISLEYEATTMCQPTSVETIYTGLWFRSIPDSIFTFPVVWKGEVMNVSETAKQMLHSGNWKYFGRHGWCPLVT